MSPNATHNSQASSSSWNFVGLFYLAVTQKNHSDLQTPLFHKLGPLEKYLSWQPCSHMISLAWSSWMSLIAFCPAMSKLSLPWGHHRLYIFCCFFEDLLSHLTGLMYKRSHFDFKNKIITTKTKNRKAKGRKEGKASLMVLPPRNNHSLQSLCVCVYLF